MKPYVYLLEDSLNGKKYIGCRFAKGCDSSDLGLTYFTSSSSVSALYKADPARFSSTVLLTGTVEEVIEFEKRLIDECDAVNSDSYYNRTSGKAVHPDDRLAGAFKEHAKRSRELYAAIASKMHAKTSREQRSKAARKQLESLGQEELNAKMQMMRDRRTDAGRVKSLRAMLEACTPEQRRAAGNKGGLLGGKKSCLVTNSQRWKCQTCGMISLPGPLGKHQARSAHSGKERVL